jgi:PAS domain S-box-containing protein
VTEPRKVAHAVDLARQVEAETKLASIIGSAMDAIISVNEHHKIVVFNAAAERVFGYSHDEALGMSVHDLLPKRFRHAHADHIHRFGETGVTTRTMGPLRPLAALRKDGSEFPIEAAISQVEVGNQKLFTVILRDVSERKAAEAERERLLAAEREAREMAEAANKSKSEFLAMMSHELRTPLNAIAGYVQLLEMEIHGPVTEDQRAALQRVQKSQTHLLRLINEVLNFARLETASIQYTLSTFPVAELLTSLEDVIAPLMASKRLRYEQQLADGNAVVYADMERVQQILLNLVSNAVKFTPPDGSITVRTDAPTNGHVAISVSDTGCGIAPENQERIFEAFVQVDRRLTREEGGVGLGLAISRILARTMGGELAVQSDLGGGATFTLTLPQQSLLPNAGDLWPAPASPMD